jgi:hypothetical protein
MEEDVFASESLKLFIALIFIILLVVCNDDFRTL